MPWGNQFSTQYNSILFNGTGGFHEHNSGKTHREVFLEPETAFMGIILIVINGSDREIGSDEAFPGGQGMNGSCSRELRSTLISGKLLLIVDVFGGVSASTYRTQITCKCMRKELLLSDTFGH